MIDLKDISVTFNEGTPLMLEALRTINLSIKEGEFITIIGGNGAGKSTLMNVISGDILPTIGTILIDDIDVTDKSTASRANFVSRVFQDPLVGSYHNLTIEENLALGFTRGKSRGLMPALNRARHDEFVECLTDLEIGLENRLKDPMSSLSGGQRQAISLLMATIRPSKIILLDEHTSALDPKMSAKVLELSLKLIAKNKLTTLMITHQMSHALEFGSRTLLMQEGTIVQDFKGNERKALKPTDLLGYFDL